MASIHETAEGLHAAQFSGDIGSGDIGAVHFGNWLRDMSQLPHNSAVHEILETLARGEFGHGLTCKFFGGRATGIGFLWMYGVPCFYCDVSGAWTLPLKSQRLWVSAAGLYYQFLANICHKGVQDWIVPIPTTSTIGARWLEYHKLQADLVYVDASHDEDDVYDDLKNYWKVLKNGAPGSPLVATISARMVDAKYDVNFLLSLMDKDLRYAAADAATAGVELRTSHGAETRFAEALQAGYGGMDMSAVVEPVRKR